MSKLGNCALASPAAFGSFASFALRFVAVVVDEVDAPVEVAPPAVVVVVVVVVEFAIVAAAVAVVVAAAGVVLAKFV